jgi:GNAT superfamily N-acetyltransferase
MQVEGLFDVPQAQRSVSRFNVYLPLHERDWNIGLIVGPSGAGKSTIARKAFPEAYCTGFNDWPEDGAVVEAFPAEMSIKDITLLLASVGFSSPPAWLRPFRTLSNGEQFRATLARALAQYQELCVFDEFTSVVDRVVGRIGSSAVAKTVRRRGQRFIAVTCHDDVTEWLDPDWVYTPVSNSFQWRLLRGRPAIDLEIARVHHSAWKIFYRHHYLSRDLNKSAACFCAFIEGRPVAFQAALPFVGRLSTKQKAMRGSRLVTLPDYQGVGIGHRLVTTLGGMWKALGLRDFRPSGHIAEIVAASKDPNWKLIRTHSRTAHDSDSSLSRTRASNRLTVSFEYVGPAMEKDKAVALFNSRAW